MSREQGNSPLTENEIGELQKALQKDEIYITDSQRTKLSNIITKAVAYDPYSFSNSIKSVVREHYAYYIYGIPALSNSSKVPVQFDKGRLQEAAAIEFLSRIDNVSYNKNEKLVFNKYFKGVPDILLHENGEIVGVKDIKIPLDFDDYLEVIDSGLKRGDMWEMLGYLDVLGLKSGEVCYCLVNHPQYLVEEKIKELQERLLAEGFDKKYVKKRTLSLKRAMNFDQFSDDFKLRRFNVDRKGFYTKEMHDRASRVKQYLKLLDAKFTKKDIVLSQNKESEQEGIS